MAAANPRDNYGWTEETQQFVKGWADDYIVHEWLYNKSAELLQRWYIGYARVQMLVQVILTTFTAYMIWAQAAGAKEHLLVILTGVLLGIQLVNDYMTTWSLTNRYMDQIDCFRKAADRCKEIKGYIQFEVQQPISRRQRGDAFCTWLLRLAKEFPTEQFSNAAVEAFKKQFANTPIPGLDVLPSIAYTATTPQPDWNSSSHGPSPAAPAAPLDTSQTVDIIRDQLIAKHDKLMRRPEVVNDLAYQIMRGGIGS